MKILLLLFFSLPISSQDKTKIFLANVNIGKSDINKERQIDAIISEVISDTAEVLQERDAYKYMVPPQKKKQTNCKTNDFVCIEKEIDPILKLNQKCLFSFSSNPENCYISYLKKYDSNLLMLLDIKYNTKDIYFKIRLLKFLGDSFETQNLFEKEILPFQLTFYLKEVPKFLLNPKHIVKLPKDMYYSIDKINLKGLFIETFKKLDLEIYNFNTKDEIIDALIEEQKPILKIGDSHFQNKEYSRAKTVYEGIIKAIEVGLRPSGISKVSPYILGLKARIGLCSVNEYINKINEADLRFNEGEKNITLEDLINIMREYYSLYLELDSIEYLDKITAEKVRKGLLKRTYLLKTPAFEAWEKRASELFYQKKYKDTINEYKEMISSLSGIFSLPRDIDYYEDRYRKAIEDTKVRGKKILKEFIKNRGLISERKNINYISQYYIDNEKINDIKIYQVITENILSELNEILNDPDYDEYLNNGIKRSHNRVIYQINQSRKETRDNFKGEYIPYKSISKMGLEFKYIAGLENLTDCNNDESDCFTDYNEKKKKVQSQKSFYISKFEITQRDWLSIMHNTNDMQSSSNPSYFKQCGPDCPVENISYKEANQFVQKFCEKEGYNKNCPYKIPSSSEWEFAAKGWELDSYPGESKEPKKSVNEIANYGKNCDAKYSGSINLKELSIDSGFNPLKKIEKIFSGIDTSIFDTGNESIPNYFQGSSSSCGTDKVGNKASNFFDVFDLSGNVAEFCTRGSGIGICGGSWASMDKRDELKTNSFLKVTEDQKNPTMGLRLIYSPLKR